MNIAMDNVWFDKDKRWQQDIQAVYRPFYRPKNFLLKAGNYLPKLRRSLGLIATASLSNPDGKKPGECLCIMDSRAKVL